MEELLGSRQIDYKVEKPFACRSGSCGLKSEESNQTLPNELIERIIAKVPFPLIFKARGLSKSWLARFSLVESLQNEVDKDRATYFQMLVHEWSNNWGPLFPVCMGRGLSFGFNRASQEWVRLPSLSFLPEEIPLDTSLDIVAFCNNGVFLSILGKEDSYEAAKVLYVANIFTRSWKTVPVPPNRGIRYRHQVFVHSTSMDTFKLIVIYGGEKCSVQIFDSKSNVWTSCGEIVPPTDLICDPVSLNGVLYAATNCDFQNLLAIDLENETAEELELEFDADMECDYILNLVVCDAKLLLFVKDYMDSCTRLLQIDIESLRVLELSSCPPVDLQRMIAYSGGHYTHGDSIFFITDYCHTKSVVYNMSKDEWSVCEFTEQFLKKWDICDRTSMQRGDKITSKPFFRGISFEPGLSPFKIL